MAKVYEFLATGFEEVEALTPVDVLRRGGLNVKTVSMNQQKTVKGAHNVPVECDVVFEEESFEHAAMLVLICCKAAEATSAAIAPHISSSFRHHVFP